MQWFRMYSEVLNDPKIQRLHPGLVKDWLNLLCVANENTPRGSLPDVSVIAYMMRIRPHRAKDIVDRLLQVGLLEMRDDGLIWHHGWEKRQRTSDDISERVALHRSRTEVAQKSHSERTVNGTQCPTSVQAVSHIKPAKQQFGNVTVTPPEADTDTDTDNRVTTTKEDKPPWVIILDYFQDVSRKAMPSPMDITTAKQMAEVAEDPALVIKIVQGLIQKQGTPKQSLRYYIGPVTDEVARKKAKDNPAPMVEVKARPHPPAGTPNRNAANINYYSQFAKMEEQMLDKEEAEV